MSLQKTIRKIIYGLALIFMSGNTFGQNNGQNSPWFFIQITDPQFGMFENNKGFEKETILYEKAVVAINKLNPDFVVITGDFVHDSKSGSQINEFKRITSKINPEIPVYFTAGNHDLGTVPDKQSIAKYNKNYGSDKFAFTHKGSAFIGVNTSYIKADWQRAEQKQFTWLTRKLNKSRGANHIMLFCHYPFFNKSVDEPDAYSNIGPEYRKKYLSLFESHKVTAVFSGHYHNNALNNYNGVQLITTSALGKPLGKAPSGMRIVKIYNDKVEHEYYGLDELPGSIDFN
jgi:serine/threonine-protein phosphatase CPPED1